MPPLDRWLPEFAFSERHERRLSVAPERALEAALAVPSAPDRIVRLLFGLRGIPAGTSLGELRHVLGFDELERTPTSFVAGGAGTPWRPRGGRGPFADPAPGTVRMALAFWAEPNDGGAVLVTETRVAPVDDAA
ncbi:MAG: hypothetical protein M3321_04055, partial [Actinomycetota bacterium]|nr:hypothetical protein [Actinomycetota bacterium]